MHELHTLRRQYFALYPPYLLQPLSKSLISEEGQRYLLSHLLCVSTLQPEAGYTRQFWRKLVKWMEDAIATDDDPDIEIDERFYSTLTGLMAEAGAGDGAPKTSYRTFFYDPPPLFDSTPLPEGEGRLTLLEEQILIQGGTTGLRTWTAALHLAHHILHNPQILFSDPNTLRRGVVELGGGTGFLAVLLGQLGVDVISTDLGHDEPDYLHQTEDETSYMPLDRLRNNIQLNNYNHATPTARALDWTDATSPSRPEIWERLRREQRTIIAADVIYDPDLVPPLVDTIDVLMGESALVSATVRNEDTLNLFLQTCNTHGLHVDTLTLSPVNPSSPTFWDSALDAGTDVRIMRIMRIS